jgi:hypothetical protein
MKQAKHNQQVQVTRSSKVKEQVNRQGDARFVLGCSFLFRESMSMLVGCGLYLFDIVIFVRWKKVISH